jgi:2'-5' RNA ligase
MRAFVSIELTKEIRSNLEEIQREFRKLNSRVRWIKAESLHLTLSFLGNIEESQVEVISSKLENISKNHKPFEVDISGISYFGRARKPSSVWAKVEPTDELKSLFEAICEGLGKLEDREFVPHITLSRVKETKGLKSLVDKIEAKKKVQLGRLKVSRIHLVESKISHSGAVYSYLGEFLLG